MHLNPAQNIQVDGSNWRKLRSARRGNICTIFLGALVMKIEVYMYLSHQAANWKLHAALIQKRWALPLLTAMFLPIASNADASIPVYECTPSCSYVGDVGSVQDLFPPSPGTPVTINEPSGDGISAPLYSVSDTDTCAISASQRQNDAIAALSNAGIRPRVFSIIRIDLADGNFDSYSRTGGPAPNYWTPVYSSCN